MWLLRNTHNQSRITDHWKCQNLWMNFSSWIYSFHIWLSREQSVHMEKLLSFSTKSTPSSQCAKQEVHCISRGSRKNKKEAKQSSLCPKTSRTLLTVHYSQQHASESYLQQAQVSKPSAAWWEKLWGGWTGSEELQKYFLKWLRMKTLGKCTDHCC